jgi:hypothetical protein
VHEQVEDGRCQRVRSFDNLGVEWRGTGKRETEIEQVGFREEVTSIRNFSLRSFGMEGENDMQMNRVRKALSIRRSQVGRTV